MGYLRRLLAPARATAPQFLGARAVAPTRRQPSLWLRPVLVHWPACAWLAQMLCVSCASRSRCCASACTRRSVSACCQRAASVRELAADRLRRVVTALLTLFRTGIELSWQTVDVLELARHLHLEKLRFEVLGPVRLLADLVARAHGGRLLLHACESGCSMELCFAVTG
jgi:hypothetical protein